jgi:hypothetical protein
MKLLSKIKEYGVAGIAKVTLKKIFKIEIMKFHYLKIKLDSNEIQNQLQDFDLNVKELIYGDFLLGDKSEFYGEKLEIIKNRFEDPAYKAYGIVENEILIYSAWISLKKLGLPIKSNIMLQSTEGYLEDDFCHSSYRGRGIHGKMNMFRLLKLHELGKKECIVVILDGNSIAMKTQIKSGARDLGCFNAGKIFGIPFVALNKSKYDSQ